MNCRLRLRRYIGKVELHEKKIIPKSFDNSNKSITAVLDGNAKSIRISSVIKGTLAGRSASGWIGGGTFEHFTKSITSPGWTSIRAGIKNFICFAIYK
jgi:hypothetical protein